MLVHSDKETEMLKSTRGATECENGVSWRSKVNEWCGKMTPRMSLRSYVCQYDSWDGDFSCSKTHHAQSHSTHDRPFWILQLEHRVSYDQSSPTDRQIGLLIESWATSSMEILGRYPWRIISLVEEAWALLLCRMNRDPYSVMRCFW